jgi:hypothetical protein
MIKPRNDGSVNPVAADWHQHQGTMSFCQDLFPSAFAAALLTIRVTNNKG